MKIKKSVITSDIQSLKHLHINGRRQSDFSCSVSLQDTFSIVFFLEVSDGDAILHAADGQNDS